MTFPFYFKPIEIDGALVFDGGLVNNFPAKNAIDTFHPDIIIGNKVANNAGKPDEDDIMIQLENLIMQKTNYEIPKDKGILIESNFSDVGLLDFDKIDTIAATGYRNAEQLLDSIKSRISRRVEHDDVQKKREAFNRRKPKLLFQNVQVEGVHDALQRKYIIQSIKHRDDTIDLEELRKEYFKLVSNPQIRAIRPVSIYNPQTGYFDLHLKVKQQKPLEINFGGNVSTKPINQGFLGLDYRFFKNRAYTLSSNIYFGRFYSSAKVGGRIDFPSKLPVYLSGFLTFNRWDYYASNNEFFFEDVVPPAVIADDNNLRFELGFPVGTRGKLVVNSSFNDRTDKYYLQTTIEKNDEQDKTSFNSFSSAVAFEENSFNYKQFPTEGINSKLSATFISGEESYIPGTASSETGLFEEENHNHHYWQLGALYDNYFQLNRKFTLGVFGEGIYNNKGLFSNYYSSILSAPAFAPTPFSKTLISNNFRSNKYLAEGLKTIFHLGNQLHFRLEGYAYLPLRKIEMNDNLTANIQKFDLGNTSFMGLGGFVYHTNVGPVSLTANYFDNNDTKWYMVFSFGYVLFNKKGY
jgi:NTE family protein